MISSRPALRPLSFLLLFVWLIGCTDSTNEPTPGTGSTNQYLVNSSLIGEYSRSQLTQRYASLGPVSFFINHPIKVYKLVYKTKNTDGSDIQASGAIVVPDPTDKNLSFPLLSEQHGTITFDADAPSYNSPNSETYLIGSLLAANGYITVLPDFIGYGESKNVPHPYQHRASLASASLDMIRAAREFIEQQNVNWNQKLFTAGYSLGGYATMALQKKIEEETGNEFNLIASSCGAGAYHQTAFVNKLINEKTHGNPSYNALYAQALTTIDRVYNLNKPLTYYLKEPYASAVQNNPLTSNISVSFNEAITDSFRKAINEGTDKPFLDAVKDNDVHDWKPRTPMHLYYGTADELVFPFNTTDAVDAMRKRGATNIEGIPLEGKDHTTAINDFLFGTFTFFGSKR